MFFNTANHGEHRHIGNHINQHIEAERGEAHGIIAHNGQHNVAGLRDRTEGHETFQIALTDGEKVGNGDGQHNNNEQQILPIFNHGRKHFHQDGTQRKGCCALAHH